MNSGSREESIEAAPRIDKTSTATDSGIVKLPLSLVIIAKDEEGNIGRCLSSVPFAQELLVVENGSTDRTRSVAEEKGAHVLSREWMGFGPQKRWAAKQAKNDWVLALDADEALSPELQQELVRLFESGPDERAVYYFPRLSFHMGRWIRHGGWFPDRQPRLFNRKHSQWTEDAVHERIQGEKRIDLQHNLHHYVFKSLSHQVQTNDRYSSLQAESFLAKGGRFSLMKALVKPWVKFIECYLLKLGFLDGYPGFVIAVGAGYSVFIRWAKIWEASQSRTDEKRR